MYSLASFVDVFLETTTSIVITHCSFGTCLKRKVWRAGSLPFDTFQVIFLNLFCEIRRFLRVFLQNSFCRLSVRWSWSSARLKAHKLGSLWRAEIVPYHTCHLTFRNSRFQIRRFCCFSLNFFLKTTDLTVVIQFSFTSLRYGEASQIRDFYIQVYTLIFVTRSLNFENFCLAPCLKKIFEDSLLDCDSSVLFQERA